MLGSPVRGDIRISAPTDLWRLLYVSGTWKGSLHRQRKEREKGGRGLGGKADRKLLCRGRATRRLRVSSWSIMQRTQVPPHDLIHFVASPPWASIPVLWWLRVNGLNSQLTPAWRGREAVIHVNQPACSYLVQNKVMFCSSSYQRPDKTPVFMHASTKPEEEGLCFL